MTHDFQADIDAVNSIDAVPTILNVVCATTGMGFAAVARVTEGRWIACNVRDDVQFGLAPGGELKLETTICHEIRQHRQPVIIDNVAEDAEYRNHHTPAIYGLQSYISMPIILQDGTFFGTLCAIDTKPRLLKTPTVLGMFKLFAELIAFHLDAHARIALSESRLATEVETSNLREQFIAVLGHDLRNPLASIGSGASILLREPQTEKSTRVVQLMQNSIKRMAGLIDNVMDFARGRLGGGITLAVDADASLGPALEHVVSELRASWPDRQIEAAFDLQTAVSCDPARIAQLFSNLLANALAHGVPELPITVAASAGSGVFRLSVANRGAPVPAETLKRLFQPFFRGDVRLNQQGLGLGLFIVSEIARAHGGTIDVTSTAERTQFTFQMPLQASVG
ncbi:GAF domain-containing sensor histidine kinase [Acidisphaera sp. L21]|uniref:GAF domain-containing sensor histidine kinase n=1 Tax=Acidisphaera sp. L21 TaxID=1641851 RepID=UPI00131C987A|nr:GAF domain-containing sensor histidine kinase [Acidisphaera sp. L21]